MISRSTARGIAEAYVATFGSLGYLEPGDIFELPADTDGLYDFLFDNEYPTWVCNDAKKAASHGGASGVKDFIMKLHTGESGARATSNWTWEQRRKLGQKHLENLAEDILQYSSKRAEDTSRSLPVELADLKRNLELDGYFYVEHRLIAPERDVLDVQEEAGVLQSLYLELGLENKETASHHLKLTEEHYLAGKWDDSIANARKFLECVAQEVAASHSKRVKGAPLAQSVYSWPAKVRDYLEQEELLETKEKEALASVYGLLSHTGGHPYMAQNEQARLLRHLALTFSQFVMLRLRGMVKESR